jgi:pyridoxamine 5'-phosphate oxidase-like protein
MSIPVALESLHAASAERGNRAFLLTVTDDARPHAVHVTLEWDADTLTTDVGRSSARNAASRPTVSLLYPGREAGDYSLIVDGTAMVTSRGDGNQVRITPTKAVLHRPAAAPDPAAPCANDCVPILSSSPPRSR